MIYNDITELIGNTPLLRLNGFMRGRGLSAEILAKPEFFNPAGSVKDRAALFMIKDAEERGALKPGSVVIEPTSGNTGIGLAAVAAVRGYKVILTMPETMSSERRKLLAAYGAELILTDGALGMKGAIAKAEELKNEYKDAIILGQFVNPANARAHYETTGPEIWTAADGKIDIFVSAVGTGGTVTGTGRYLKEKNPAIRVVAVEPAESPVLSGGKAGAHKIQGIGAGFIPEVLDTDIYDEVIAVESSEAFRAAREVAASDAVLTGISGGAALAAAAALGAHSENTGKRIAVILPDTGERYLSSGLF